MYLLEFSFSQYVFQCLLHSFIIAFVIEALLKIWREERPLLRLRFRLLVILIPVLSFPLYQLVYPQRGSFGFRRSLAIFDINQWLLIGLGDGILVWHAALVLLGVVTAVFLLQEAIPILLAYLHREACKTIYKSGTIPKLDIVLEELKQKSSFAVPRLFLLTEEEPAIYTNGIRKSSINISWSLIEVLDQEELEGALAHEMAHIMRRDNTIDWVLLLFRFIMFYNPVALVEFRRIIHEREKLCDDIASSLTGKPLAFASSLIKVFRMARANGFAHTPPQYSLGSRILSIVRNLESHSDRVRVEDRIIRMARIKKSYNPSYPHIRLGITTLSLILFLFFVV